jgi:hypothetical protein
MWSYYKKIFMSKVRIGLIAYNLTIGNILLAVIINVLFVIVGIHIWIQKRK